MYFYEDILAEFYRCSDPIESTSDDERAGDAGGELVERGSAGGKPRRRWVDAFFALYRHFAGITG